MTDYVFITVIFSFLTGLRFVNLLLFRNLRQKNQKTPNETNFKKRFNNGFMNKLFIIFSVEYFSYVMADYNMQIEK